MMEAREHLAFEDEDRMSKCRESSDKWRENRKRMREEEEEEERMLLVAGVAGVQGCGRHAGYRGRGCGRHAGYKVEGSCEVHQD